LAEKTDETLADEVTRLLSIYPVIGWRENPQAAVPVTPGGSLDYDHLYLIPVTPGDPSTMTTTTWPSTCASLQKQSGPRSCPITVWSGATLRNAGNNSSTDGRVHGFFFTAQDAMKAR
jgi:hypothetical protein